MRAFEKRSDVKRSGAFLLDWLEFSYLPGGRDDGLQLWTDFMDDFPEFENEFAETVMSGKGMNGYTNVYRFTDLYSIAYSPDNADMGIHVIFPSHGLYKLCELFGLESLDDYAPASKLFKILTERSCRITRMDVCFDDYTKRFKPADFVGWAINERIRSKHRHWQFVSSCQGSGATFYLGKRGRDRLFRCYDKAFESNGEIDAIRYELELKGVWAMQLQKDIAEGKKYKFSDMIRDMFEITNEYERDDGAKPETIRQRKYDAGIAPEYLELLQLFDKLRLSDTDELKIDREKRVPSWTRLFNWLNKYVMPSLYMYREVMGKDVLDEVIAIQERRLDEARQRMLVQYKDEHKKFEFKYGEILDEE